MCNAMNQSLQVRVPLITAYIAVGVAAGPAALNLIPVAHIRSLGSK
jgi:hypothetical protein